MSDIAWLSITSYCSQLGISFSILTNCTLLVLLSRKQTRELGSYKYLMATFCLFSMFYSSVEWFMQPLIHIYDDTTLVIQRKRFDYPWIVARLISSTYCGCFATSFTLFAVHFIYRYLAVCKPRLLAYFSGYRFFAWLLGIFLTAFSWAVSAFFCFPESERTVQSFREVVTNSYNLSVNETAYVPYTFWKYQGNRRFLNPINLSGLVQHVVVMSISFTIVFFCGYQTAKLMKKTCPLSGRAKQLQRQLFNALVIQTLIPMIFMYIPTSLLLLLPFLSLNIGAYGNMAIVSVHLYPGIDPLVSILLIHDFRRTLSTAVCNVLRWTTLIS